MSIPLEDGCTLKAQANPCQTSTPVDVQQYAAKLMPESHEKPSGNDLDARTPAIFGKAYPRQDQHQRRGMIKMEGFAKQRDRQ